MMEFGFGLAVGALAMLAVIVLVTPRQQEQPPSLPPAEANGKPRRRNMHD